MKGLIDQPYAIIPSFLLLGIMLLTHTQGILAEESWSGRVIRVKDGDTLVAQHGKRHIVIRLYGIDCPEKNQTFGPKATEFTIRMTLGKIVKIRVINKDRYGRIVGIIDLPEDRTLNAELVKFGLAWWYRRYAPKDQHLKTLELQARNHHKGLWGHPMPIPPWEYRKTKRGGNHEKL